LDMVGDKDLKYTISSDTPEFFKKILNEDLNKKKNLYSVHYMRNKILDDHVPFQQKNVPTIDLIDFSYGPSNFFWHTESDTLDKISDQSLKISGDLALRLAWRIAK